MNSNVFIILLNYRGYEYTTACINSLRKITYDKYSIVIVDNCSNDGSFEQLQSENPDIVVLLSDNNNGFSAGNNIGIRYAMENGADYVMLLNNDTEVEPDFLTKMLEVADEKTVVTPSIYYFSNKNEIWYADGKISKIKCTVSNGSDKESKYCDYASGCCLLIPRAVIDKVGFWAEEYFMYYEDMDYSLRILKHGFKIYYKNDAIIYHKVGKSSGSTVGKPSKLHIYYNVRNRMYIIKKFNFRKICYTYTIVTRLIKMIYGVIFDKNERVIIRALVDYKNGRMGRGF